MASERNKALLRLYRREIAAGNLDVIDGVVAENAEWRDCWLPTGPGPRGERDRQEALRVAFPDGTSTVDDVVGDGSRVAVRWTLTGTQDGPISGVDPTGRSVRVRGATLYRIADGRIASGLTICDVRGMLRQLGVIAGAAQSVPPAQPVQRSSVTELGAGAAARDVARRFYQLAFTEKNVDASAALLAQDVADHSPPPLRAGPGRQGLAMVLRALHDGIPDLAVEVRDMAVEGAKVATHVSFRGTSTGLFFGLMPTGQMVTWECLDFLEIEMGQIARRWSCHDTLAMMQHFEASTALRTLKLPPIR